MNEDPTGGPAFPIAPIAHANGQVEYGGEGMTLRDYFAAKAMASIELGNAIVYSAGKGSPAEEWPTNVAKISYKLADAMLAERERKESDL